MSPFVKVIRLQHGLPPGDVTSRHGDPVVLWMSRQTLQVLFEVCDNRWLFWLEHYASVWSLRFESFSLTSTHNNKFIIKWNSIHQNPCFPVSFLMATCCEVSTVWRTLTNTDSDMCYIPLHPSNLTCWYWKLIQIKKNPSNFKLKMFWMNSLMNP